MRLYISPGACSLSPHIVSREAGIPIDLELVSLASHTTRSGVDYYGINPKGSVPALELEDGQVLTEGPAIVQYLADQKPGTTLLPPCGTLARSRVQEWLSYVGGELHKSFSPLFGKTTPDAYRTILKEGLAKKFAFVAKHLEGKAFLTGDDFTVADAYLFTILRWSFPMKIDLPAELATYFTRIADRPAVKAALDAEKAAAAA